MHSSSFSRLKISCTQSNHLMLSSLLCLMLTPKVALANPYLSQVTLPSHHLCAYLDFFYTQLWLLWSQTAFEKYSQWTTYKQYTAGRVACVIWLLIFSMTATKKWHYRLGNLQTERMKWRNKRVSTWQISVCCQVGVRPNLSKLIWNHS